MNNLIKIYCTINKNLVTLKNTFGKKQKEFLLLTNKKKDYFRAFGLKHKTLKW